MELEQFYDICAAVTRDLDGDGEAGPVRQLRLYLAGRARVERYRRILRRHPRRHQRALHRCLRPGIRHRQAGIGRDCKIGIVAATAHPQVDYAKGNNSKFAYASSPTQIINYVSCHDDLTLTDKLKKSMPYASEAERLRAAKLAQTIVFTSQGTPFMFCPGKRCSGIRRVFTILTNRPIPSMRLTGT